MKDHFTKLSVAEYGNRYRHIVFPTDSEAQVFEDKRRSLMSRLSDDIGWGYGNTKADCNTLSNGCQLCGDGSWSCLFINGECNCTCFYCPASQDEPCLPTTNSVSFNAPSEYVAYLKEFGFKGASISGGEPLLTFDLTLSYVAAIKEEFGSEIYLWMYTNGSLVTEEILIQLRDAGLDEIRFDIGATDYNIKKLKMAVGVIPVVTVEIPAVPEDIDIMKGMLKELAGIGLDHLNLHQLRLTPYNFDQLMARDYTYTQAEKITVIESELTALELMVFIHEHQIDVPINYCSFPFKNRYQGLAARNRNGKYMLKDHESLTENGFIRLITFAGTEAQILELAALYSESELKLSMQNNDHTRMSLHPSLLYKMKIEGLELLINYFSARQLPTVSYRNPFKTIKLTKGKNMVIERFRTAAEVSFTGTESASVCRYLIDGTPLDTLQFEVMMRSEKTAEHLLTY